MTFAEAQRAIYIDFECLKGVQSRTSPIWHLYYALIDE